MLRSSRRFLFVFDFDQTIVDLNTDTYIVKCLPQQKLPKEVLDFEAKGWNTFMQEVLRYINFQGVSVQGMQECLRTMQLTEGFDQILNLIRKQENEIDAVIVSDSNQFFIDTILDHLDARSLFKHVITNPCRIEDQHVRMTPFHSHTCPTPTCPKNLCKRSALMDLFQKEVKDLYEKVYYFGDGQNDYCPLQLLEEKDVAFARKNYRLDTLLNQKPLKCTVFPWENGHQIIQSHHFSMLL